MMQAIAAVTIQRHYRSQLGRIRAKEVKKIGYVTLVKQEYLSLRAAEEALKKKRAAAEMLEEEKIIARY